MMMGGMVAGRLGPPTKPKTRKATGIAANSNGAAMPIAR